MARTNATDVKAILRPGSQGGAYDDINNPDLTPFITSASVMVDRVNTLALERSVTLSSGELEDIEKWLAAHFYVQTDRTLSNKYGGGSGATFDGRTGYGLNSTLYGQSALRFDYSGVLNDLEAAAAASATGGAASGGSVASGFRSQVQGLWLGKAPSNQTDYVDRD